MAHHFDVNVIARHLCPSAFAPYEKWSTAIAHERQMARLSAQHLTRTNPGLAGKIMSEHRACKLMNIAAAIRARG